MFPIPSINNILHCYRKMDPFYQLIGIGRRRQWHPTPALLPEKSHGRRSLVGCSPWGRQESDTTERLHFTSIQKGAEAYAEQQVVFLVFFFSCFAFISWL